MSSFIQIRAVGSKRRIFSATKCVLALQGHPRTMILVPIESVHANSICHSVRLSQATCLLDFLSVGHCQFFNYRQVRKIVIRILPLVRSHGLQLFGPQFTPLPVRKYALCSPHFTPGHRSEQNTIKIFGKSSCGHTQETVGPDSKTRQH